MGVVTAQSEFRPHPEGAVPIEGQGKQVAFLQVVVPELDEFPVRQVEQSVLRCSHPDASRGILGERQDGAANGRVVNRALTGLPVHPVAQVELRPRPDGAIMRFQDRGRIHARQRPPFVADRRETSAVVMPISPVLDRKPQAAITGLNELSHLLALGLRQVDRDGFEFETVEAHQAVLCSEPDVAVLALRNGGDLLRRKTLLPRPILAVELKDRFVRVERVQCGDEHCHRAQKSNGAAQRPGSRGRGRALRQARR